MNPRKRMVYVILCTVVIAGGVCLAVVITAGRSPVSAFARKWDAASLQERAELAHSDRALLDAHMNGMDKQAVQGFLGQSMSDEAVARYLGILEKLKKKRKFPKNDDLLIFDLGALQLPGGSYQIIVWVRFNRDGKVDYAVLDEGLKAEVFRGEEEGGKKE